MPSPRSPPLNAPAPNEPKHSSKPNAPTGATSPPPSPHPATASNLGNGNGNGKETPRREGGQP